MLLNGRDREKLGERLVMDLIMAVVIVFSNYIEYADQDRRTEYLQSG